MNKAEVLTKIRSNVLLPVLRANSAEEALKITGAVFAGGIRSIEVTMTVPNAVQVISDLDEKFRAELLIGAGTVLDAETANNCFTAGAKFIVTPCLIPEVIEFCNENDIPVLAGSFTPTEVFNAWKAGADVVKIFPASVGGAGYLKALKGPFPQIELMPTGGISLETAEGFLDAGAFALGVGTDLVQPKTDGQLEILERIESLARRYAGLIAKIGR